MVQQELFHPENSEGRQVECKVILLYLIEKMDFPLSNSQITQFVLEEALMTILEVQTYLEELSTGGFLEQSSDNGAKRYTLTDEGMTTLELFTRNVPPHVKSKVMKYVQTNRKTIKQEFENTANYFYDHNSNEYIVKCGIYDDELMLMEINMSVVTKEQAIGVTTNWKNNVTKLYGQILNLLIKRNQTELDDHSDLS